MASSFQAVFNLVGKDVSLSASVDQAKKKIGALDSALENSRKLGKRALEALGDGIRWLWGAMMDAMYKAKEISILSKRMGMPVEEVARLSRYAETLGINVSSLGRAMMLLGKEANNALNGSSAKAVQFAKSLGLSNAQLKEISKGGINGIILLKEQMEKVGMGKDRQQAMFTQLLGRRAFELAPMTMKSSTELKDELGQSIAMGKGTIESLVRIQKVYSQVMNALAVVAGNAGSQLESFAGVVGYVVIQMARVVLKLTSLLAELDGWSKDEVVSTAKGVGYGGAIGGTAGLLVGVGLLASAIMTGGLSLAVLGAGAAATGGLAVGGSIIGGAVGGGGAYLMSDSKELTDEEIENKKEREKNAKDLDKKLEEAANKFLKYKPSNKEELEKEAWRKRMHEISPYFVDDTDRAIAENKQRELALKRQLEQEKSGTPEQRFAAGQASLNELIHQSIAIRDANIGRYRLNEQWLELEEQIKNKLLEQKKIHKEINDEIRKNKQDTEDHLLSIDDLMHKARMKELDASHASFAEKKKANLEFEIKKMNLLEQRAIEARDRATATQQEKDKAAEDYFNQAMAVADIQDSKVKNVAATGTGMRAVGGGGAVAPQALSSVESNRKTAENTTRIRQMMEVYYKEREKRGYSNETAAQYTERTLQGTP